MTEVILTKPKILAVDDIMPNLVLLERFLRSVDAEVIKATSGAEALQLVNQYDFCVAILDVQMPEMDGYELTEKIRSHPNSKSLPVIFVSAIYADEYHHGKGYEAGAVDFISKPFNPDILVSKVKVFIELYNQRRRLEGLVTQLNEANAAIQSFNAELEAQVRQRTEELRVAYKNLERIDKTKTDFITVAAHELRTPLTVVKGYAEMLRDMVGKNMPESLPMIQGILTGESRMLEVVNSLLDITKLDSETLKLHKRALSLKMLVEGTVNSLREAIADRRQHVQLKGLETLPGIEGDPDLLQKVFTQLLINAIKFTPDDGDIIIRGVLHTQAENNGHFVEIAVTDTGIGIAPENHELIFEKFFQTGPVQFHSSGKTKFKGGGPGLGLAIARGIVNIHGGRIWVESAGYDEATLPGSTFHVLLPA